jgi:beta-glucosidase
MSFYSGMEGGTALANILTGKVNPSGKLPFTVAHNEEDYPPFLTIDDGHYNIEYGYYHGYTLFDKTGKPVDYPFGFGLSYTNFELKDVQAVLNNEVIEVTAVVHNTGHFAGDEIVQVYAGSLDTEKERPVKLLKGFSRVFVKPGEQANVKITIPLCELRFFDSEQNDWVLDKTYRLFVGTDSQSAMKQYRELILF